MIVFQKFLSLVPSSAAVVSHATVEPQALQVAGVLQKHSLSDRSWCVGRGLKKNSCWDHVTTHVTVT